jgi:hypothetical protein
MLKMIKENLVQYNDAQTFYNKDLEIKKSARTRDNLLPNLLKFHAELQKLVEADQTVAIKLLESTSARLGYLINCTENSIEILENLFSDFDVNVIEAHTLRGKQFSIQIIVYETE